MFLENKQTRDATAQTEWTFRTVEVEVPGAGYAHYGQQFLLRNVPLEKFVMFWSELCFRNAVKRDEDILCFHRFFIVADS